MGSLEDPLKRRTHGLTLLELAVACGLLGLLCSLVAALVVSFTKACADLDGGGREWQRACHSLEAVSRDLRNAVELLFPTREELRTGSSALTVTLRTPEGLRVRSWQADNGELLCLEFATPQAWQRREPSSRVRLGRLRLWVQSRLAGSAPLLRIRLEGPEHRLPMVTQIAFPVWAADR